MMDRRSLLLAGASALSACATAPPAGEPMSDGDFRVLVDGWAQADRRERAVEIAAFDPQRLSAEGRILYDAIAQGSQADGLLAAFPWGRSGTPYVVSHRYGAYRRANASAAAIDAETTQLRADADAGIIAPGAVLDAAIAAVDAAAGRASGAAADAMRRQSAALAALRPRSRIEAGVWALPGGADFYELALQFQLGEEISPRTTHRQAQAYCRELQREADTLLRTQGLTRGSVGERLRAFGADERQLYADSADGKAHAVADMNAALARLRPLLRDVLDGADAPAEVRLVPPEAEADGMAGRREGGVYHVDFGAIRSRPRWTLATVAYHELVPGHILQAPFEHAAQAPALQTRYASGYSEGWSIYAERLADEVGAYADDPASRIGYLQWMLFRFGRIVADTGIHAMRWSRERAVQELRDLQGDSIAFVSIEEDVLRMCAQPGAAAAQGLAAMRIAELRTQTRRRLSARDFHAAMLRHGPLSPPSLAQAARAAGVH
ncbi:DUF885 family protein [Vitreimonas flagellata]|uniref:DUF885 family protein n=1 Tax=Vitreimonas flagellata TaxID=2560861 RepID=UPI001431CE9D|nr:DUF885 family protein [Vitreimonas flagellata]